jgi:hypothetical protein
MQIADLEKLPPIFPAKVLEEWSHGALSTRRLIDHRRDGTGPAFIRPPGSRQILYTRDAVAEWLSANEHTRTVAA